MARHHYETLQQVFDDAYRGLYAQGFAISKDHTGDCAYRGAGGLRCAIGHCIPDDNYDAIIEGIAPDVCEYGNDRERTAYELFGSIFGTIDRPALLRLQEAHDYAQTPQQVLQSLQEFAASNGLTIPSVEEAA